MTTAQIEKSEENGFNEPNTTSRMLRSRGVNRLPMNPMTIQGNHYAEIRGRWAQATAVQGQPATLIRQITGWGPRDGDDI
jgi:hypothetical protein